MELRAEMRGPDGGQGRLLPDGVEDRIRGTLGRIQGAGYLVLAVCGWLSLLSWSAQDPSLTHSAHGEARNWLGAPGAVFSDLLLQTCGLAAVALFLPVTAWGVELVRHERVRDWRLRTTLAVFAVLALAGALAAVPTVKAWPLHHGFGGILGDLLHGILAHLLASINAARADAAAGLIWFGAGLFALFAAMGLSQKELSLIWQREPMEAGEKRVGSRGRPKKRRAKTAGDGAAMAQAQADRPLAAPAAAAVGIEQRPADRPAAFDWVTDTQSQSIAERFAPADAAMAAKGARKSAGGFLQGLRSGRNEPAYKRPPVSLLKRSAAAQPGPELVRSVLRGSARLLEDALAEFGIRGIIKDMRPGPVVTVFEVEPQAGTKLDRVVALADDIARAMGVSAARVTTLPGRNLIGIELPNIRREIVSLRELLESEAWKSGEQELPVALGRGAAGEPFIADLARMPHLLVAGSSGSGKTVGLNAIVLSLLFRHGPGDCRLIMIDPRMLELGGYSGIPHLLAPVVSDVGQGLEVLRWAVREAGERCKRMSMLGVRSLDVFNNRVRNAQKRGGAMQRTVQTGFDNASGQPIYEKETLALEPLPAVVIVVAELADLMMASPREVEDAVQCLAQAGRAAGIHLVLATQRPSSDVVTAGIRTNVAARLSFKVAARAESRTILGEHGAEQLLGAGDMLLGSSSAPLVRVHGAYVSEEEIEQVVTHVCGLGMPEFKADLMEEAPGDGEVADEQSLEADERYDMAVAVVLRERRASVSYLQRRLQISYNQATAVVTRMEKEGLVGAPDHTGSRPIFLDGPRPTGTV